MDVGKVEKKVISSGKYKGGRLGKQIVYHTYLGMHKGKAVWDSQTRHVWD